MQIGAILISTAVLFASSSAHAQSVDDDLRLYAVGVVNVTPFQMPFSGLPPFKLPFSGYGIYLRGSTIITAAHVVGHWPLFTNPKIVIGGEEIQAKVIKKGAFPQLDLAQLSIEQSSLPASVGLRRGALCKEPAQAGTDVVVVYPDKTVRSRVISYRAIAPQYQSQFGTLLNEPQGSGSGVFDADKRCLLGIVSAAITRSGRIGGTVAPFSFQRDWSASVGYFVPASTIATFLSISHW
jgi:hypothetical protein